VAVRLPHLPEQLGGLLRRRQPPESRTVLIVDANAADRQATRRHVQALGCEAVEAQTPDEALQQMEAHLPDYVLLALDLPDANALDVLGQLREADPNVNVIVLARDWRDARTAEAMRQGAAAYLAKPFSQDDLRELLSPG
jgi:CheY-like chemotaxis protein